MPLLTKIVISAVVLAAPFLVWLALYAAARAFSVDLRPILPLMRVLRWVAWGGGLALCLAYLAHNDFPSSYGMASLSLSIGLSFPETWIKRRFAPGFIERTTVSKQT